ncbi:acyl dehydratase [Panacagrimonas perspica]|uniref:Acyl dehydratase n=1 Tax=Panacagrimonas perspica TaxID=381431 RepID=A0A4S3K5L7_9GAMM|nr:MaoC family dehydratase [Panacagrimonas perspica]TDU27995.1 acyl dehydratase [Panacagrimonas perspica]THD03419.1 acyl dehydratase [Panacagrimonas perspica]
MKFAEFEQGQVIQLGPATVTEDEILAFARQHDPQWFHTDPARAQASRWNGLIASGWHTCSIAMRLMVDAVLGDSESLASPGMNYLKWPAPVRPGDRLELKVTILEKTVSGSGRIGSLKWRWELINQDGVLVLDLEAVNLFTLKT